MGVPTSVPEPKVKRIVRAARADRRTEGGWFLHGPCRAAIVPSMSVAPNQFSAAGPALGYLAQVDYALLLTLGKMDDQPELAVSIETTDDIVFDDPSTNAPLELWQSKHHIERRGSLGDASPDIWKSIANWISDSQMGEKSRILLSTVDAPQGSAAAHLTRDLNARDPTVAHERLVGVAEAKGNKDHIEYYDAFLNLKPNLRLDLLRNIYVVDHASCAADISGALANTLRKSVRTERRTPLVERLRGWWAGRVAQHLTAIAEGRLDSISAGEVEARLHDSIQSLRDDMLPLDYSDLAEPAMADVATDDRVFVEQLRIIAWHSERIRLAVYDHNRAFLQRSRWHREDLVHVDDMESYDRRLIEEWRRHFLPTEEGEELEGSDDDQAQRAAAREKLLRLETSTLPEIRSALNSGYMPMGTLHILADNLRIGWHPHWIARLRHRIGDAAEIAPVSVAS